MNGLDEPNYTTPNSGDSAPNRPRIQWRCTATPIISRKLRLLEPREPFPWCEGEVRAENDHEEEDADTRNSDEDRKQLILPRLAERLMTMQYSRNAMTVSSATETTDPPPSLSIREFYATNDDLGDSVAAGDLSSLSDLRNDIARSWPVGH